MCCCKQNRWDDLRTVHILERDKRSKAHPTLSTSTAALTVSTCAGSDKSETFFELKNRVACDGKKHKALPVEIKSLRIKSYNSWPVADSVSQETRVRLKKLGLFEKLKAEGASTALCLQAIEWSKATYTRWLKRYHQQGRPVLQAHSCHARKPRQRQWTKQHQQAVLHLRNRYPLWGKRKIWKVFSRDHGFTLSISTVGRILKHLITSKRVRPVAFYYSRVKPKRKRQFKHHAKRFRDGMRAKQPGELIQMSHPVR